MCELRIWCQIRKKRHNRTKQSEQYLQGNVFNQNFDIEKPDEVWVSDSTEVSYGVNGEYKMHLMECFTYMVGASWPII